MDGSGVFPYTAVHVWLAWMHAHFACTGEDIVAGWDGERRLRRRGALTLVGAAGLAACGRQPAATGKQPGGSTAGGAVTLHFLGRGGPGYEAYFRYVTQTAFPKLHPRVRVRLDYVPNAQWLQKFETELAGGVPPNALLFGDARLRQYAAKGVLARLDAPFGKTFHRSDFLPVALENQYVGAHLYGLPLDLAVWALFYNKDLFDKAHLPYPDSSWTWAQYFQMARHLTRDLHGRSAGEKGFDPHQVVQYGCGSALLTGFETVVDSYGVKALDVAAGRCNLDAPEAVAAMQMLADVGARHYAMPSPAFKESIGPAFHAGNIAMSVDGSWRISTLKAAKVPFRWGVAMPPQGPSGRVILAEASENSIPARAAHQTEAWELIAFMGSAQGQRLAYQYGVASVPSIRSVATAVGAKDKVTAALVAMADRATLPYWCRALSDATLLQLFSNQLTDLWTGRRTARQVLPGVARSVTAILAKDRATLAKLGG